MHLQSHFPFFFFDLMSGWRFERKSLSGSRSLGPAVGTVQEELGRECRNRWCNFYGTLLTDSLCSKCFQEHAAKEQQSDDRRLVAPLSQDNLVQAEEEQELYDQASLSSLSQDTLKRRPKCLGKTVGVMQEQSRRKCLTIGCTFHGMPSTDDLCSQCFRELQAKVERQVDGELATFLSDDRLLQSMQNPVGRSCSLGRPSMTCSVKQGSFGSNKSSFESAPLSSQDVGPSATLCCSGRPLMTQDQARVKSGNYEDPCSMYSRDLQVRGKREDDDAGHVACSSECKVRQFDNSRSVPPRRSRRLAELPHVPNTSQLLQQSARQQQCLSAGSVTPPCRSMLYPCHRSMNLSPTSLS